MAEENENTEAEEEVVDQEEAGEQAERELDFKGFDHFAPGFVD